MSLTKRALEYKYAVFSRVGSSFEGHLEDKYPEIYKKHFNPHWYSPQDPGHTPYEEFHKDIGPIYGNFMKEFLKKQLQEQPNDSKYWKDVIKRMGTSKDFYSKEYWD